MPDKSDWLDDALSLIQARLWTNDEGIDTIGTVGHAEAAASIQKHIDEAVAAAQIEVLEQLRKRLDEPVDITLFSVWPPSETNNQKTQQLHKFARANVKVMIDERIKQLTAKQGDKS